MEGAVVSGSGTLRVRRKRSRMSHRGLVLNYFEDLIDGGLERSEAGVNSVDRNRVMRKTRLRSLLEVVLPRF